MLEGNEGLAHIILEDAILLEGIIVRESLVGRVTSARERCYALPQQFILCLVVEVGDTQLLRQSGGDIKVRPAFT